MQIRVFCFLMPRITLKCPHARRIKMINLNIDPLTNAISRLVEGLARYNQDITDTQIQ